jgi:CRP-like cAMP-binding protein
MHSSEDNPVASAHQPTPVHATLNCLLASLPVPLLSVFQQHLRPRAFAEGTVLWEAGYGTDLIYFPCSGMISIHVPTNSGHGIEIATAGRESAAGFASLGGRAAPVTRAVARLAGNFACISVEHFAQLGRQHREVATIERCCIDWLSLQAQQTAACATAHSAEARVSRWLLRACDAGGNQSMHATHDTIAKALGLRRTTVTLIAQRLQQTGAIRYRRGKITVCGRATLEASACDCHAVLGRRWSRLAESYRLIERLERFINDANRYRPET